MISASKRTLMISVAPDVPLKNTHKFWPNLCWLKIMMFQLSKTVSDVIISFPDRSEDLHEKMSFFKYKIVQKFWQNFLFGHFLKNDVPWCSRDYGEQKVPTEPPKPQIFNIVTRILIPPHYNFSVTCTFQNPNFLTFW